MGDFIVSTRHSSTVWSNLCHKSIPTYRTNLFFNVWILWPSISIMCATLVVNNVNHFGSDCSDHCGYHRSILFGSITKRFCSSNTKRLSEGFTTISGIGIEIDWLIWLFFFMLVELPLINFHSTYTHIATY